MTSTQWKHKIFQAQKLTKNKYNNYKKQRNKLFEKLPTKS
ncbi:hypothetical protein LAC1533_2169 [Ligilactobacillus acidipiscis]|uniref:Uncharacterized protein n=1 Tax=Ligilactobacillus acidipiscis TaxID=89059 RepID=A0A1K1KRW1_9LACO|nr:hypothetical protein LAC1533_2169 [Ligilactobacillus acidipiscis]